MRDKRSIQDIIMEIKESKNRSNNKKPCIFQVPLNLREVDESAYQPKMVSLGPFHHGVEQYQEMEKQKPHYLYSFLKRILPLEDDSIVRQNLESCKTSLKKHMESARDSYSKKIDMGDEEFLDMMLLDGCFILEFLLTITDRTPSKHVILCLDMMMLENQIPWDIINELYNMMYVRSQPLRKLILRFFKDFLPTAKQDSANPLHLLHLIHTSMLPWPLLSTNGQANQEKIYESIPNATRLKDAGIKFKIKENGQFLDVNFKNNALTMTPFKVYDHVNILFRNLVAYEHCDPQRLGWYITDYVCFIDRLINTSKDVELLQRKGLVVNGLGSEEEVAELVNNLTKNMIWDSEKNQLRNLFCDINKHCKKKRRKWRATLCRDYFSSPWSFISLLAASFILLFTGTQTVFAILAYFKPPKQ